MGDAGSAETRHDASSEGTRGWTDSIEGSRDVRWVEGTGEASAVNAKGRWWLRMDVSAVDVELGALCCAGNASREMERAVGCIG